MDGRKREGRERSSIPLFRDLGKRGAYVYSRITRSFGEARYPINAIVKGYTAAPRSSAREKSGVVIAIYGEQATRG